MKIIVIVFACFLFSLSTSGLQSKLIGSEYLTYEASLDDRLSEIRPASINSPLITPTVRAASVIPCLLTNAALLVGALLLWRLFREDRIHIKSSSKTTNL